MSDNELIAVTSRSFSKNSFLRKKLKEHFSNVKFNEEAIKLTDQNLINFLKNATHAIIGLEIIDEKIIKHLPSLKVICKMGTGIDKIDLNLLEKNQIKFIHTPGINKRSVSELVLGLIFTLLRHLHVVNRLVNRGQWQQIKGNILSNKNIGIIGFGAIGQDLASLLSVFNCRCFVFDIQHSISSMPHVLQVELDTLLKESDIISLHIPLTPENYYFLGSEEFSKMKKNAILINTARGGLVDEDALYHALIDNQISAAAVDVFEHEPHIPKKLIRLSNFFATSHIAGSTEEAIEAMGMMAINELKNTEVNKKRVTIIHE